MIKSKKLNFFVLLLSFCLLEAKEKLFLGNPTEDNSITIFVHGTYLARKLLQSSVFSRFLIYCPQGLAVVKDLPSHYYFYKIAEGCAYLNQKSYSIEQFYTFGWQSEYVYDKVRASAASQLVKELQDLVVLYYDKYKIVPKIRLIGFSHGGNVVLNTARYLPCIVQDGQKAEVEIWLFGTPVQNVNKYLVNSLEFSKVYSFYSKKDWVQRMDPQGLRDTRKNIKQVWSDRVFDRFDRCIQVEFTVNGQSISHTYYRSIFKYFPKIQHLTEQKSQGIFSGFIAVDLKK